MAKKDILNSINSLFDDIKQDINVSNNGIIGYIPDIMEFCESPDYLGLPHLANPVQLRIAQRIILKIFYRGSEGNKKIELTDEEVKWCKKMNLIDEERGDVLGKYNSGSIFRELILVWGRRCLSEDSLIPNLTDGSFVKIGDLWDKKEIKTESFTYNEKLNKMKKMDNVDIIYQGERECYKLTSSTGHQIEVTKNHPFLTERGWVKLEDLDIEKDKIAICESLPFFGKSQEITDDEAALLGYMTADGNCSQTNTFFTCSSNLILKDFTRRLNKISNNLKIFNDPWTGERNKKFQYKIVSKKRINKTIYCEERKRKFSIRTKNDLAKLLDKWGLMGKTCHYKTVPLELFKCPKSTIASYLCALFSCDGNLGIRKTTIFEFTTVNEDQAKLIQLLLSKFGIIANLRTKKVNSQIIDEKGILKLYNTKCYVINFSRKKYINILLNEIGLIGKTKYNNRTKKRLQLINSDIKTNHKDNYPFSFYKIKRIEEMGVKRTFDLSVSDKEHLQNFVSQGFMVKNSGKDFVS